MIIAHVYKSDDIKDTV